MTKDPKMRVVFKLSVDGLKSAKNNIAKYPKGCQASAVMPFLDIAQRENGGWI